MAIHKLEPKLQAHVDKLAEDPVALAKELARAEGAAKVQGGEPADAYVAQLKIKAEALQGPKRDSFNAAYQKAADNFGVAMMQLAQVEGAKPAKSKEAQALYDLAKDFEVAKPIMTSMLMVVRSWQGHTAVASHMIGVFGMRLREALSSADKKGDPAALKAAKTAIDAYLDLVRSFGTTGTDHKLLDHLPRPTDSKPKPEIGLTPREKAGPATKALIDAVAEFKMPKQEDARSKLEDELRKKFDGYASAAAEKALQVLPGALAQLELLHPRESLVASRFPHDMYRQLTETNRDTARALLKEIQEKGEAAPKELIERTVKFLDLHFDLVRSIADPWLATSDATLQEIYAPRYDMELGASWRIVSSWYTGPGDTSGYPPAIQEALKRENVEMFGVIGELHARDVALLKQLAATKNVTERIYNEAKGHLEGKDIWLHVPEAEQGPIKAGLADVVRRYEAAQGIEEPKPKASQELRASQARGLLMLWAASQDPKIDMDAVEKGLRENRAMQLELSQPDIGGRGVLDAFQDILRDAGASQIGYKLYDAKEQLSLLVGLSRI